MRLLYLDLSRFSISNSIFLLIKRIFSIFLFFHFSIIIGLGQVTLIDEDFSTGSGTTPPTGWTNNQAAGSAAELWYFNNPDSRSINSPVSGQFAIFDSDYHGSNGTNEDVSLESPTFDASLYASITLTFDHYFLQYTSSTYYVDVYDGTSWNTVLSGTSTITNTTSESIDITISTNGYSNAQIRFRYTGNYDWYWAVDNVEVTGTGTITDTDSDKVADYLDLDDDNDGILDCVEKKLASAAFSDLFTISGNATQISTTELQLTQAINSQTGAAFSNDQIDFNQDFSFSFEAYLGTSNSGADGMGIVFHNDPAGSNAIGVAGSGLAANGIADGIVLEIDTYDNGSGSGIGDISNDHTMIWDSDNQAGVGLLTSAIAFSNLEDGIWRTVTVNWNATTQTISFSLNGVNAGTFTNDLINNYFGGSNLVYFGFTSSTGGLNNDQRIRFASGFCGFQVSVDDDGDGIENHLDLDSDNDGIYDAIEAGHGVSYTNGRVSTASVGTNGYLDALETSTDNGIATYTPTNTDGDLNYDIHEIDSDDDGCNDTSEEGISDSDMDGIAGTGSPSVDADGLVTSITYLTPVNNYWQDALLTGCSDNDADGLLDIYDLDDDNDGILDTDEKFCDIPSVANPNSGSGIYPDQIYIFNWDGADLTDGIHDGDSQTFNLADGVIITATFSNISNATNAATYIPADMNTYALAYLDDLYNTAGSQEALYGGGSADVSFTVSFSATKGGQPYPLDLLALDAEATYPTVESIAYTTDGGNWTLLETYGGGGTWSGANTATVTATDTEPSGGTSIFYSENATQINVTIDAGGGEAVAFGIRLVCDTDNDNIPDYFDLNSDGDSCSDAIEGADSFSAVDIDGSGALTGGVDGDGVPTVAAGGQATTLSVTDNSDFLQCPCQIIRTNRHIRGRIEH